MSVTEMPMDRINRGLEEQFPAETSRLDLAVEAFEEGAAGLLRPELASARADPHKPGCPGRVTASHPSGAWGR